MKSHQPPAELETRFLEEHGWTWCYVEPGTDVELFGNETYASEEEARESARRAYPDVPFGAGAEDDAAADAAPEGGGAPEGDA